MIEIIAACIEDVKKIEQFGGDRIELVSALSEGGLTPSYGLIKMAVEAVKIPVNVMIRPHSKSFVYSEEDIGIMVHDIKVVKELGANGVVLGTLTNKGAICERSLQQLLHAADGLEVTFHRAIDDLLNPAEGVKKLSRYREITRILTSGGKGRVEDNIEVIREMIDHSKHIKILVGGGLTFENIKIIMKETQAPEFHFGTAVRRDFSPFEDISEQQLNSLLKHINA